MTSRRTERNKKESFKLEDRSDACSSRSNICSAYLHGCKLIRLRELSNRWFDIQIYTAEVVTKFSSDKMRW